MNIELIQGGRVLRQIHHNGQTYVETPDSGEYEIRLTNNGPNTRMAVLSVDGQNVIDGSTAGFDGAGWVLGPWQSTTIKGFLRSDAKCARFKFVSAEESYAAQVGKGTKNTGVIGLAVFDEAPKPIMYMPPTTIVKEVHHHHYDRPRFLRSGIRFGTGTTSTSGSFGGSWSTENSSSLGLGDVSCSVEPDTAKSFGVDTDVATDLRRKSVTRSTQAKDVGTGYGREDSFFTRTVGFTRASATPSLVLSLRYGVTEKLREWGVPVSAPSAFPNAFPASPGYAQPPANWRG